MKLLLQEAMQEIVLLRQRVQIAEAKVDVVEVFKAALLGRPSSQMGYCEDVVWKLQQEIQRQDAPQAPIGGDVL
jgi:hypothetical protein